MASGSPFAQHLHTNYVPSAGEINHIRSLVDERQKVVDALDVEIEALVKRREEHAKFVEEHSALLSPIRRVPNDILSLIFLTCLPRNPSRKSTRNHPALVISRVCQRWRHLSLSTALLWTTIDIQTPWLPDPHQYRWNDAMTQWGKHMQAILALTQLWISRSANCPLTVSFSGGLTFPDDTDLSSEPIIAARERVRSIVDALCDVSCRWKTVYLSVEVGADTAVDGFFQIPSNKTPLLETLYVNNFMPSPDFMNQPSQRQELTEMMTGRGLVKAPRLCRLGVGSFWSSPSPLPVKWAHLTELFLGPILYQPNESTSPLFILAMCVNLIRCSICHQAPVQLDGMIGTTSAPPNYIPPSGVCHLARLRTLELRGFEPPPLFAANLELPSLQELVNLSAPSRACREGLGGGTMDLIRKFGEGLTDVTLEWGSLNEPRLLDVLQHLPNVVNLRLVGGIWFQPRRMTNDRDPVVLDSVLEKLTPRSQDSNENGVAGGKCYCPKLKKFGCKVEERAELSEEAFARFIAARRNPLNTDVALLTSFVAAFPFPKPTPSIRGQLEEMGVDLQGMVFITAYPKTQKWHLNAPRRIQPDFDVDVAIRDHEDYVSTVGPFRQRLGDLWVN